MKPISDLIRTVAPGRQDIWYSYLVYDRAYQEVVYMAQHVLGVVNAVLSIENKPDGMEVLTYMIKPGKYDTRPGNWIIPVPADRE